MTNQQLKISKNTFIQLPTSEMVKNQFQRKVHLTDPYHFCLSFFGWGGEGTKITELWQKI